MLTDLHDKLVLKGDFDACEELIEKAVNGKTIKGSGVLKAWKRCCLMNANVFHCRAGKSLCCSIPNMVGCHLLIL